jgi:hypothetical protein
MGFSNLFDNFSLNLPFQREFEKPVVAKYLCSCLSPLARIAGEQQRIQGKQPTERAGKQDVLLFLHSLPIKRFAARRGCTEWFYLVWMRDLGSIRALVYKRGAVR